MCESSQLKEFITAGLQCSLLRLKMMQILYAIASTTTILARINRLLEMDEWMNERITEHHIRSQGNRPGLSWSLWRFSPSTHIYFAGTRSPLIWKPLGDFGPAGISSGRKVLHPSSPIPETIASSIQDVLVAAYQGIDCFFPLICHSSVEPFKRFYNSTRQRTLQDFRLYLIF